MINVDNIHKSFGDQHVLKGITTAFEAGECSMVIGKSGAGKTVFMNCLVGLITPEEGSINLNDRNIVPMNQKEKSVLRKEMGMLFQKNALFDSMTVEENVRFPLDMFTTMTVSEKQERVDFCLERVALVNANDKFPSEISGGMMKRVALARAMVLNPQYLFCDEPNSGLDPQTGIVIDNLIQEITQEYDMTTIVITHDMNSVMETGENISFIHQGKKWWTGNKEDILKTDNHELNEFVYSSKIMQKFKGL